MAMASPNFDLRELVAPTIYNHPKIGYRCIHWINPNLAPTLEAIKQNFGEIITVNNWHIGGPYKNSGLRDWHFPEGAEYSPHYYGGAADTRYKYHTPTQIYLTILNNQDAYPFIIRMESAELTVSWLHIEVGNTSRVGDIVVFNPY